MVSVALIAGLALCVGYFWPRFRNQKRYNRWYQSYRLQEFEPLFNTLFKEVNGFERSRSARQHYDLTDYVYGEIVFLPFVGLLSSIPWDKDDVFYDLGSGVGKAVFACAMVCCVKKAVGIELLLPLHQASRQCKELLLALPEYEAIANKIDFIEGDFLNADFSDATIVFVNATTLHRTTWDALCQRIAETPSIRMALTTSKPLPSTRFEEVRRIPVLMSWGPVDVYISAKLN